LRVGGRGRSDPVERVGRSSERLPTRDRAGRVNAGSPRRSDRSTAAGWASWSLFAAAERSGQVEQVLRLSSRGIGETTRSGMPAGPRFRGALRSTSGCWPVLGPDADSGENVGPCHLIHDRAPHLFWPRFCLPHVQLPVATRRRAACVTCRRPGCRCPRVATRGRAVSIRGGETNPAYPIRGFIPAVTRDVASAPLTPPMAAREDGHRHVGLRAGRNG
jgi:hypothetical protein